MAQDYPLPRFHFQVDWGGAKISFSEVTGIVMESDKTEYRDAGDNTPSRKITGLIKNNNITLKRGKFERDFNYSAWINGITNKRIDNRRDMTIKLLNEKHEPVAVWTAARCFPVKVTAPNLKSDANEATIESLEITHKGLTLVKRKKYTEEQRIQGLKEGEAGDRLAKMHVSEKTQGFAGISPGDTIKVTGIGEPFEGKMYVTGERHTVADGNWETDVQFGVAKQKKHETKERSKGL